MAGTFYYLCTVLDGFSRFIVAWDVRRAMQEADAEIVLQRWPGDVGDADTLFDGVAAPPPGTSRGCSGSGRRISPRDNRLSVYPAGNRLPHSGDEFRQTVCKSDIQENDRREIAATTQEQVKTKLTAEQLASLQPVAATPSSMMQMCQSMHSMTGKKMADDVPDDVSVVFNSSERPGTHWHGVLSLMSH